MEQPRHTAIRTTPKILSCMLRSQKMIGFYLLYGDSDYELIYLSVSEAV